MHKYPSDLPSDYFHSKSINAHLLWLVYESVQIFYISLTNFQIELNICL